MVAVGTLFLVDTSQNAHFLPSICINNMESYFLCKKLETLVGEVVCHDKMHISSKNGFMVIEFDMYFV
jgi:hypothetical protein